MMELCGNHCSIHAGRCRSGTGAGVGGYVAAEGGERVALGADGFRDGIAPESAFR